MRTFASCGHFAKTSLDKISDQIPHFPRHDYASLNFGDCPMKAAGFSNTTR
jgi:hypothetical protein